MEKLHYWFFFVLAHGTLKNCVESCQAGLLGRKSSVLLPDVQIIGLAIQVRLDLFISDLFRTVMLSLEEKGSQMHHQLGNHQWKIPEAGSCENDGTYALHAEGPGFCS